MYQLMEIGDKIKATDEWWDYETMEWHEYVTGVPFEFIPEGCVPIRRKIQDNSKSKCQFCGHEVFRCPKCFLINGGINHGTANGKECHELLTSYIN